MTISRLSPCSPGSSLAARRELSTTPSTFGRWVVFVIGYYFFGMVVLLAAAAVLTLAGFKIRLPERK